MSVHPVIKEAYEKFQDTPDDTAGLKRGTVWFTQGKPLVVLPGGVAKVVGVPKFCDSTFGQAVLIDRPEEGYFPEELLVMPVVEKPDAVHCRRITVTLRNVSNHSVTVKRGMQIAHLYRVDVINAVPEEKQSKPLTSQLSPSFFNFGDSPVPPEWKERLRREMMERKEVFSCSEFDVGC